MIVLEFVLAFALASGLLLVLIHVETPWLYVEMVVVLLRGLNDEEIGGKQP